MALAPQHLGRESGMFLLCADICRGMTVHDTPGDSEALRAFDRCVKRASHVVASYRGELRPSQGERLLADFPGDEDAFQAAIAIQERISSLPPCSGITPAVRIGICCGRQPGPDGAPWPEAETAAVDLASMAQPDQILFAGPAARQADFPPGGTAPVRSLAHLSLTRGEAQLGVFELDWRQGDPLLLSRLASQALDDSSRFVLRFAGRTVSMDDSLPVVTVGREPDCGLVLQDSRSSRRHGRFERRGNLLVFVDNSRNGTYITQDGTGEIFVRQAEMVLGRSGRVSFAAPSRKGSADQASFQVGWAPPTALNGRMRT